MSIDIVSNRQPGYSKRTRVPLMGKLRKRLSQSAVRRAGAQKIILDASRRYDVNSASALLDQCRAQTYLDIQKGRLKVIREGRRTFIPGI